MTTVSEPERLAAVARYDILDTPPDGAFDRIAGMAARLLRAPMATVSIVDTDRIWFKATHGLDGVAQIGRDLGLCASAILQDGPYLIPDTLNDPRAADNPLVCGAMGIRFYAAAPLVTADGYRLGTVNVLDTEPREVTAADLDTLRDLAAVVIDELEVRLSAITTLRRERELRDQAEADKATIATFAATLQRTLLPPSLPAIPGLELACHYHTASPREVGGDFYDVFSLGCGRWGFFLGDVCGHGAEAAALTSLARYTLRAAAWHDPDPVSVLTEVNTAFLQEPTSAQRFVTILFGTVQPHPAGEGFTVTLASGGHPPSLHLYPGTETTPARVEEIRLEPGMLVGAFPDARFVEHTVALAPGETLLLYTDGLTEARPAGDLFGEMRLIEFLAARTNRGAGDLVADLTALIDTFEPEPTDDIALLALRAR